MNKHITIEMSDETYDLLSARAADAGVELEIYLVDTLRQRLEDPDFIKSVDERIEARAKT
ncbi:hypothetical protein [Neorhizobium alkalisoli]|nr:hypothetical protein [Neorhizobium alkalisoli]